MSFIEGWEPRSLNELADYINGFAFKPVDWGKDGLPIIRIEQLRNPDAPTDYYSGILPAAKVVNDGDLIFSWSASLFLRIWSHGRAALNQHLFKVVERESVDRTFLKSFIEFYLPELTRASHGSTMQHITRKELDRFSAQFPINRCEQGKIAEILSTVGRAIEQTEELISKQQRVKTGLMQDLFSHGVDENGDLRSEQTHEFKDSALGRIPIEWESTTLGKLADFASGYAFKEHELSEDGWRVVRISNLHKPDFPYWHYDGLPKASWIVKPADVLFSWAGVASSIDCVRYYGSEALLNQHIYNLKFSTEELKLYTYFFLQSYLPKLRTEIEGGAGQLHLTKEKIRSIPVPKPSTRELNNTITLLLTAEDMMSSLRRQLSKLERLRSGLMGDLLTGKWRVTALLARSDMAAS